MVYVGHQMTDGYKKRLEAIGRELGIKVYICLGGFENKRFAKSWERKTKLERRKAKETSEDNESHESSKKDVNDDHDQDEDHDVDDHDDDEDDDDELKDKNETKTLSSLKLKRKRGLNSKPRLGNVRKMVRFFNSTTSSGKFGEDQSIYGGRMVTRSLAKKEQGHRREGEDDRSTTTASERNSGVNDSKKTQRLNADDVSDDDFDVVSANKEHSVEEYYIDFSPGTLILADDLLVHRADNGTASTSAETQNRYLQTLRMIQAFVMEKCNHYQIGLILTSQFTLSGAGSNQVSHLLRSIRSNLDGTVIFPTNLKNLRHFLSSFTVGEQFQKMKSLFTYLLENSFSDDPADPRTGRPYVFISHGSNNANSYFSIRQFMFNLNDPLTKPFLPLAFINLKK